MKIHGIQGLSHADIEHEVARGARFVSYQWALSLVVITLRRSSSIYFLRPTESGFLPNFLWCLFSLVFGWWGFPWGPIYTIGSLWTNLRGGMDLTDAVIEDMRQGQPSPLGASAEAIVPVGRPSFSTGALAAVGSFVLGILLVVVSVQGYKRSHMPVALMNGLDVPYEVSVNGASRVLRAHQIETFEIPEGVCTVSAKLPGGVGRSEFTVDSDKFSIEDDKVLVLNPDAAALIIEESTIYTKEGSPTKAPPAPTVRCALQFAVLPAADYFFAEFPSTISMSKHASEETQTRIFGAAHLTLEQTAGMISRFNGPAALKPFVMKLGALMPDNDEVMAQAVRTLSPADLPTFYEQHLKTRPVVVNWHRYYQSYVMAARKDVDLRAQYQSLAEASPEEGELAYLCGRVQDSPEEEQRWFERALAAKNPSVHAHRGLAHLRACAGDYEGALNELDAAAKGGISARGLFSTREDCLLALGRKAEALKAWRELSRGSAFDVDAVEVELHLAFVAEGRAGAEAVLRNYLGKLSAEQRKNSTDVIAWLRANIAYYEGNAAAYAATLPAEGQEWLHAMLKGDSAGAAKAIVPSSGSRLSYTWLLVYLNAVRAKDPSAGSYWDKAVACMAQEHGFTSKLAEHLRGQNRLPLEKILTAPLQAHEKRVVLAALAVRDPANRKALLAALAPVNQSRRFPHHLIAEVAKALESGQSGASGASL